MWNQYCIDLLLRSYNIIVVCCHHNEWFFARPKSYWSNFLLPSPSYCSTFFWIYSLAEEFSWILETFLFYFDKFSLMSVKRDQTFSSHKQLVNVSFSSYLKVVCLRILVKLWQNKEHSHQKAKRCTQWTVNDVRGKDSWKFN